MMSHPAAHAKHKWVRDRVMKNGPFYLVDGIGLFMLVALCLGIGFAAGVVW